MNLYNLTATLTLDDSDYKEGIKESEKGAKEFSKQSHKSGLISAKSFMAVAAAVGVAAGALYKLTTSTINFGDDIDKNSQKLGMSAESYQKWSYLMQMAGTDIGVMKEGMKSFNTILDNASKGQADALLTLEKLGLGYEDFADLSVEDAFKLVVEQLQDMEDGTNKTALAQKLFGGAGQELMPILNDERGSVDELFKKFEDLGIIMSDDVVDASAKLSDELTLLKDQFKTMLNQIGVALYPVVEFVIDFIKKVKESEIVKKITASFGELIERLEVFRPIFEAIGKLISFTFDNMMVGIDNLLSLINVFLALISGDFKGAFDNIDHIVENTFDFMKEKFGGILDFIDFDGIKETFKKFYNSLYNIFKDLFDNFSFDGFMEAIKKLGKSIGDFFKGIFNGISFDGLKDSVSKVLDSIKEKFNGVSEAIKKVYKAFVNFFIDGLNKLIKGANKFSFNAPDWVPGIGGKTFGINIPLIPRLQRGMDYVPKDMYPAYLDAGERVLTRTENKQYNAVGGAEGIAALVNGIVGASQMGGSSGGTSINLQVQIGNKEIKDFIYKTVDDKMKSQGFKSLKKVGAYND